MNTSFPYPLSTVGGLIHNQKNEILLVRSRKWSHLYGVPGGKIAYGETMEAAFKREVREETNLEIYDIQFVCIQDCIHHKEFYQKKHFLLINFAAYTNTETVVLNDEAYEYRWVEINESLGLALNEPTRVLIHEVLKMNLKR